MKIFRIHQGKSLPIHIRLVLLLFLGILIFKIPVYTTPPFSVLLTIFLSSFGPAIWFATDIIIIDLDNHVLFKGVWIMGFKMGKKLSIGGIDELIIDKVRTKRTVYTLENKQNITANHEYRAFLKLESGEKFFLISHPLKQRIIEKCKQIADKLGLDQQVLVLPEE